MIASAAMREPMIPGSTPSTPACAHEGTSPGSGRSGNTSRYSGPPGANTLTCPANRRIAPHTTGTPAISHASATR